MDESLDDKTFIGWGARGLDPINYRSGDGRIVCRESREVVRFTLAMGLVFGPGLAVVTLLMAWRGERRIAAALTAMFSLTGCYALFTALFRRRRIVFDPHTGTVELFRGGTPYGTLSRSDIVALRLEPVERTMPGVSLRDPFRWTNYLISAHLRSDRQVLLLESPIEPTITTLYRTLQGEFMRI